MASRPTRGRPRGAGGGPDPLVDRVKRSALPARKTPLVRAVPLPRQPAPTSSRTPQGAPKKTGPDEETRALVLARDGAMCVVCGKPGTDFDPLVPHHRQNRGAGGSKDPAVNLPSNLIHIHFWTNRAFEDTRRHYYTNGWKVKHPTDPATVPVLWWDGKRYLLDSSGNRHEVLDLPEPPTGSGQPC